LALEVPDKERERTADLKLYPENLFNFLTESHDVIAIESVTQLAPALDKNKPRISERKIPFSVFLMDSLVLLGHATLPYSGSFLPDVGQQWTNFAGTARGHADEDWPYLGPKPHKVRAFIDLLEPGKAPGFYYLHLVLPHLPFEYSEGGKMDSARYRVPYANVQNRSGLNRWGSETLNTIAQQSHLIQLAFVDMMFGKIMDKLEAENLFDDSLLIVTADHGVSFFWDDEKLPLADAKAIWNFELDQIPLLIKKPNQVDSIVSDTPVESIDIAPTIAEAVGRNLPWEADGKSILHAAAPSEHESRAHDDLAFAPDRFILSQKSKTFGSHSLESVYNIGPHKEIVGRSIAEFEHGVSELAGVLRRRQEEVELESPLLPTYVVGSARSVARKKRAIAIVINEKIRGTVEVLFDEEEEDFLVRIPPQSWRPGRNDISLYEIARGENGDAISLSKVGP
jgi:hypothetical protein